MAVHKSVGTAEDSTDSDDSIKERRPQFSNGMRKDQDLKNKTPGHEGQWPAAAEQSTVQSTCGSRRGLCSY
ncbi:hypothetical protein NFI96_023049 [Prochilodus magdalenae]|nr:hypothetical protein NFI96_023049 [Prochilodus magdalenae]